MAEMYEVFASDLRIGDRVAKPEHWIGVRVVASIDSDGSVLTGDPFVGWRRDWGTFLRFTPPEDMRVWGWLYREQK